MTDTADEGNPRDDTQRDITFSKSFIGCHLAAEFPSSASVVELPDELVMLGVLVGGCRGQGGLKGRR